MAPFADLREFMDVLRDRGDLMTIDRAVNPVFEVTAYARATSDVEGPAILCSNVQGFRIPVVAGIFAARRRMRWALGIEADDPSAYLRAYLDREDRRLPCREVTTAPCKQVIRTGDAVDLTRLPILKHCERDAGFYITAGINIGAHPLTGERNASIHRMLLLGRDRLTLFAPLGRHLRTMIEIADERGLALPIATAIGVDPIIQIASQARTPFGVDELEVAGGMRGAPVDIVRCETIPLWVPAGAEIVIEGVTVPKERHPDGPFGEYPGTYSGVAQAPVVQVTAITMRVDAIYQDALTGMPMTENHWMMEPAIHGAVYRIVYTLTPEIAAINVTPGGATRHHVVVAIRKRHETLPRNIIAAVLGAPLGVKQVIVVDDDIDVFDARMVEWAVNTRVQPDKDVLVLPPMYSPTLDPSAPASRTSAKWGIDATMPLGRADEFVRVYTPGEDSPAIRNAIASFMRQGGDH